MKSLKIEQRIKQQLQGKNVAARAQATQKSSPGVKLPGQNATSSNNEAAKSAEGSVSEGAHEFSDFVTISSDERSNAILVYGTKGGYQRNWSDD